MWNIHGCRAGKGSLERVAKTTSQKHCRSHGSGAGNRPNKCRVITGERKLRDSCELCSWRWKCLNETLGGQRHYSERQTAWVRQATGRASADRSWWSRMTLVAFIRRPHTRRYTERMTNEDEDTLDVTLNDNVDARLNFHVVDCMVDKTYPHWIFFGDWMYVFRRFALPASARVRLRACELRQTCCGVWALQSCHKATKSRNSHTIEQKTTRLIGRVSDYFQAKDHRRMPRDEHLQYIKTFNSITAV